MEPRICILADKSIQSTALTNALAANFNVSAIILESRTFNHQYRLLKYRAKHLGVPSVIGQLLLLAYDHATSKRRSKSAIENILKPFSQQNESIPRHEIKSVNDPEAARILNDYKPSICCVSGTSIIGRKVIRTVPILLNIHCGVTPAYRGVHGGFWAVYQQDFRNVGVTIHKIDKGVDTGDIIYQETVQISPDTDTHHTLVAKQYVAGIPLMIQAVHDALDGTLSTHKRDDLPSRQWFSPTLKEYCKFRRIIKGMQRNEN